MDLLHIDFTSNDMTMEPNRLPKVANDEAPPPGMLMNT